MNPGHVYILGSDSGTLYMGVTSDLRYRVIEHQLHLRAGFATRYGCCRLLYAEPFGTITDAIAREKQLKGWRREKKLALVRKHNPTLRDLALHWEAERLPPDRSLRSASEPVAEKAKGFAQGRASTVPFDSGGAAACAQDDRDLRTGLQASGCAQDGWL
jgi:putative endonuclease